MRGVSADESLSQFLAGTFYGAIDHGLRPGVSTDIVCVGSGDLSSQMRPGLQTQRMLDNAKVHATGTMPWTIDLTTRDALPARRPT
ncbi:hypothetical protein [Actinomadura sp. NPDC048394]|uniref:hypothetical protein n=1 Tax=Actinomadura sp. NPDC048394 TaxID=3158223 RepID=UPI0033E749C4